MAQGNNKSNSIDLAVVADDSKIEKSKVQKSSLGEKTLAVHAGAERFQAQQPLCTPIYNTATFIFRDSADVCGYHDSRVRGETRGRHEYGRYTNPTVDECERRLAALDNGEDAILFPSGMSAISTTLLALIPKGGHVIISGDCYRKTLQLCTTTLTRCGLSVSVVPVADYDALEQAILPETKIVLFESPTNPYLRVIDLKRLVSICRPRGILTAIDATFASPINQRPLDFGVDLTIHAATKYLSGHNNLLAGVVIARKELTKAIRQERGILGAMPDSNVAGRIIDQVKTLALRVAQHNESALKIAEFLETQPAVDRVWYPGLRSHPEYEIAKAQMNGFGGVISFEIKGTIHDTARFIDCVKIPKIAPSFGGVDSLIEQPAYMSFYEYSTAERHALGIKENLVRFAVGVEDTQDLVDDLKQALSEGLLSESAEQAKLGKLINKNEVITQYVRTAA